MLRLMVARHGTLDIVGDGTFMVLSVPVSTLLEQAETLRLETLLFGKAAVEQSLQATATRRATDQRQPLTLTPNTPAHVLFR